MKHYFGKHNNSWYIEQLPSELFLADGLEFFLQLHPLRVGRFKLEIMHIIWELFSVLSY